ncbi:MAG: Uncharacterized protein G01um101413_519 [Parcubacteria group bacterium Gr01-1014_13]|nr:MAG: Uncharacterized protein G01um101413_519 [Parcubacteria group bacterium Gr01-1014_13]
MKIVYKKRFEKNFKKLPPNVGEQFYQRLNLFLQDKFDKTLNNHSVYKVFPNCRSINVNGDYRVIFEDHGDLIVFITIDTHSNLY